MRSHPAGKGLGGDLDFGAVMAAKPAAGRPADVLVRFDMAAIGRKPVIDPFARKGAR